jgi:hypothetical protein
MISIKHLTEQAQDHAQKAKDLLEQERNLSIAARQQRKTGWGSPIWLSKRPENNPKSRFGVLPEPKPSGCIWRSGGVASTRRRAHPMMN